MSVAGPMFRMKRHRVTDIVRRLTVSANLISQAIGFHTPGQPGAPLPPERAPQGRKGGRTWAFVVDWWNWALRFQNRSSLWEPMSEPNGTGTC